VQISCVVVLSSLVEVGGLVEEIDEVAAEVVDEANVLEETVEVEVEGAEVDDGLTDDDDVSSLTSFLVEVEVEVEVELELEVDVELTAEVELTVELAVELEVEPAEELAVLVAVELIEVED